MADSDNIAFDFEKAQQLGLDEPEWLKISERLGRNANEIEAKLFATLWSDRVSFKSSQAMLESIMEESPDNALSWSELRPVDIGDELELFATVLAENHEPVSLSEVSAMTCLNSAITSIGEMEAKPLATLGFLASTGIGSVESRQLIKAFNFALSKSVISSSIPNVQQHVYLNPSYQGTKILNFASVGIRTKRQLAEQFDHIATGDPVVYIGVPTGTEQPISKLKYFSDESGSEKSSAPARLADPLLTYKLNHALEEIADLNISVANISLQRGGLALGALSLCRLIKKAISIDLNRLPKRDETLLPESFLFSETCNRQIAAFSNKHYREISKILTKWELQATNIGQVTNDNSLSFEWNHRQIAEVPVQFAMAGGSKTSFKVVKFPPMLKITSKLESSVVAPKKYKKKDTDDWAILREATTKNQSASKSAKATVGNLEDIWTDLLANANLCSKKFAYQLTDYHAGSECIFEPGSDSAILQTFIEDKNVKIAIALSSLPQLVSVDPYLGTAQSIAKGLRSLAARGAKAVGLSFCLNFGNPNDYKDICDIYESIRSIGDCAKQWNLQIISQQVDLNNWSEGTSGLPAPVFCLVGRIPDKTPLVSNYFLDNSKRLILIGNTTVGLGSSEYQQQLQSELDDKSPELDFDNEIFLSDLLTNLISQGLVVSATDIVSGGSALALTYAALSGHNPAGATLKFTKSDLAEEVLLFAENSPRFLLSTTEENFDKVIDYCTSKGIHIAATGEVGGKNLTVSFASDKNRCSIPIATAYRIWSTSLERSLGLSE
jgi:phosphoribosylformylglycinamidine synthase